MELTKELDWILSIETKLSTSSYLQIIITWDQISSQKRKLILSSTKKLGQVLSTDISTWNISDTWFVYTYI